MEVVEVQSHSPQPMPSHIFCSCCSTLLATDQPEETAAEVPAVPVQPLVGRMVEPVEVPEETAATWKSMRSILQEQETSSPMVVMVAPVELQPVPVEAEVQEVPEGIFFCTIRMHQDGAVQLRLPEEQAA